MTTFWRCPVHRDDLEQCIHHCTWWREQWVLTVHAQQSYWTQRKHGVRSRLQKRRDKFTQRWRDVAEIVEQAVAA